MSIKEMLFGIGTIALVLFGCGCIGGPVDDEGKKASLDIFDGGNRVYTGDSLLVLKTDGIYIQVYSSDSYYRGTWTENDTHVLLNESNIENRYKTFESVYFETVAREKLYGFDAEMEEIIDGARLGKTWRGGRDLTLVQDKQEKKRILSKIEKLNPSGIWQDWFHLVGEEKPTWRERLELNEDSTAQFTERNKRRETVNQKTGQWTSAGNDLIIVVWDDGSHKGYDMDGPDELWGRGYRYKRDWDYMK